MRLTETECHSKSKLMMNQDFCVEMSLNIYK